MCPPSLVVLLDWFASQREKPEHDFVPPFTELYPALPPDDTMQTAPYTWHLGILETAIFLDDEEKTCV